MDATLSHIEEYFNGQLSAAERNAFEARCGSDPKFAKDVALYLSMRSAIRSVYRDTKKKDFELLHMPAPAAKQRTIPLVAWVSAIAASVTIAAVFFFNTGNTDPKQLASDYFEKNLSTLSVTMGSAQDSLALGVVAYNEGDFERARTIFNDLKQHPEVSFKAIKFQGLTALAAEDYVSALAYFRELAAIEGMYANPGKFYQAVVLMKRSEGNDVNEAKEILQEVVARGDAGHKEARRWLEELN